MKHFTPHNWAAPCAGDELLAKLGAFLRATVPQPRDIVRIGGQSFVVVWAGGGWSDERARESGCAAIATWVRTSSRWLSRRTAGRQPYRSGSATVSHCAHARARRKTRPLFARLDEAPRREARRPRSHRHRLSSPERDVASAHRRVDPFDPRDSRGPRWRARDRAHHEHPRRRARGERGAGRAVSCARDAPRSIGAARSTAFGAAPEALALRERARDQRLERSVGGAAIEASISRRARGRRPP